MTVERRNVAALHPPPGYAHVAVGPPGRLVFTAGAVPLDAAGEIVAPGDYRAQTEQVLRNLDAALAEVRAAVERVVKTTVYVASPNPSDLALVWDAFRAHPIAAAPSTLLGVAALGYRGQLVEVEAVAVI